MVSTPEPICFGTRRSFVRETTAMVPGERMVTEPQDVLRVQGVSKRYGKVPALASVSFAVSRGECLGLLGPNGAGKSTLLSIVSGLLGPDQGEISVCGQTDPTRAQVRSHIGLVSQNLALYPNLTPAENLRVFGRTQGLYGAGLRERVAFALALSDLEARANDRVHMLSGGMQRRLHLVCALLHEPVLLLLDEPTAGVDPQSREHMFRTLERLKAEGLTLVYSTHLMEEAERLCERVAIIDHGRLVALDTPHALVEQHGGYAHITGELRAPLAERLEGINGTTIDQRCEHPLQWLAQLTAAGGEPRVLHVRQASLEEVFLTLTGHALRDA